MLQIKVPKAFFECKYSSLEETKAFIGDFAQEKSEAPPEKPVEEHKLETKTTKAEPKKESASFGT